MPELAFPIWALAGLLAIPLVWWLHKFHKSTDAFSVSAIFLWSSRALAAQTGSRISKIDPLWLLRAITALCLFLAAGQPSYRGLAGPEVHVWFDDAPSMASLEEDGQRWELAVRSLVGGLEDLGPARVVVHSMFRPGKILELETNRPNGWPKDLANWLEFAASERIFPYAVQMARDAEHWLVTDGANPGLEAWLVEAPITHIVQVGTATENVALSRLSLRRSLREPDKFVGLVRVHNFGKMHARRELLVTTGDRTLLRKNISVSPDAVAVERFAAPASTEAPIAAVVGPADALPADDDLTLDPRAIAKVPVSVDSDCGPFLRAALAAHPALRLDSADDYGQAQLALSCGLSRPQVEANWLWFRQGRDTNPVTFQPVWDPAVMPMRDLVLRPEWLRAYDLPAPSTGARPVLTAGDVPLVVAWEPPWQVIEIRMDIDAPGLTARPEFAAMIGGLVDLALGRPLLDEVATRSWPPAVSSIAPQVLPSIDRTLDVEESSQTVSIADYLILLAWALLLVDMLSMSVRFRQAKRNASTLAG